ncbi:MAG: hypothetical protein P1V20_27925 [Verrucomicrobiales bacterium]|nr:hypothetical protein [Verrucomicrobiales bacterium]
MVRVAVIFHLVGLTFFSVLCQADTEPSRGPWGELISFPVILEPDDYSVSLSSDLKNWREGTVWKFDAENEIEVANLLMTSGFSDALAHRLTSRGYMTKNATTGWFEIRPPEEVIVSLKPEQRASLYPHLYPKDSSNPFNGYFGLAPGGVKSLLQIPSSLPSTQIDLINRLSYKSGQTYRLADINYIFEKAQDYRERFQIIKFIRRQNALSLHLIINTSESLENAAKYWSSEGRNKEILPILESVARTPGVDKLDIAHLLPPFPRKVIFTYPSIHGEGIGQYTPDCFWTAASFFSDSPPDRFLDLTAHTLLERYMKVPATNLQFGDLIIFTDKDTGKRLHACNHIAGEYVFTKNGASLNRPWVFATLRSVINTYLERDMSLSFFRLKPGYRK